MKNLKIPVNPRLPKKFSSTPNVDRPEKQIRQWWCRPYVTEEGGSWHIYCLDGGAWDRPTWRGSVNSCDEAVAKAREIHQVFWSNPSSNGLPLPFPFEMRFEPIENANSMLKSELVGPARLISG